MATHVRNYTDCSVNHHDYSVW